jgi:hypothetical protein
MVTSMRILLFVVIFCHSGFTQVNEKGHFDGILVLKPEPDGRNMSVVDKFSYTDWEGHTLTAQPGFVSDGATIPRVAWSLVGGPWEGKYRQAAVIHDVGCVSHEFSWKITHRLFYEAMLDSEVARPLALTMYYAVLAGGPRWELLAVRTAATPSELDAEVATYTEAKAQEDTLVSLLSTEKITVTKEAIGTTKQLKYKAKIYEVLPSSDLVTKDDLNRLLATAEAREKSPAPMTPGDIDDLVMQKEKIKMKYAVQEPDPSTKPSL